MYLPAFGKIEGSWLGSLVNDRGQVAATGEMIYGNINGVPYKYSRVDGKHWTATGKKREAA